MHSDNYITRICVNRAALLQALVIMDMEVASVGRTLVDGGWILRNISAQDSSSGVPPSLPQHSAGTMADTQEVKPSEELAHVQKVWTNIRDRSPIYQLLLDEVDILSATKAGSITARLTVKPAHLNSKGTLHRTVSTCIIDWAGGLAIASTGLEKTGVSTDIHTSFVSTAREGDQLEISARASKVGGTLAFTLVEIKQLGENETSTIVSTGSHTKYVNQ